ncbi:nucleotidyltransferase family protein [Pseudoxanthomonas koreensis]|uniref:nucleotidyltransferase family protein n=1 Tax=Pseudoxanthomonas koreensis TaxID=266061 RepID=UPI001EE4AC85|nr:nucleotidyltransferase family protein [Pseudoxanthomonas koreensis]KAF1695319.1 hypothetical protein CSC64_03465 [Pseudoxanthomonas koreensis]
MSGQRGALAAALAGSLPASRTCVGDSRALLDCAWHEGVLGLLAARVDGQPEVPEPVRAACADWIRAQTAVLMMRQVRLRQVLVALDEARIRPLVLKGAALSQWLYPSPHLREASDVDLLFASRIDAERASATLASLDFFTPYRPGRFQHELLCRSADGKLDLDLHWALSDWPMLGQIPDFTTLLEASIPLPGLGTHARGLDAPHALLHACIHRASNLAAGLGDRLKWLYDLHLLAAVLDRDGHWPRFVAACLQAQACGIADEGLAASAGLFGTVVPGPVRQALADGRKSEPLDAGRLSDWRYIQRLNFRALPGWGARLAWLGDRLLPPAGHLRALYGEDLGYPRLLWRRLRRAGSRLVGLG